MPLNFSHCPVVGVYTPSFLATSVEHSTRAPLEVQSSSFLPSKTFIAPWCARKRVAISFVEPHTSTFSLLSWEDKQTANLDGVCHLVFTANLISLFHWASCSAFHALCRTFAVFPVHPCIRAPGISSLLTALPQHGSCWLHAAPLRGH